jgi:hypothetical protein
MKNTYKKNNFFDLVTQLWVKSTGKNLNLDEYPWLKGPSGEPDEIGSDYFEKHALKNNLNVRKNITGTGLMTDFHKLKNKDFNPDEVDPDIINFYEKTTEYSLDVWSKWCGPFKPFGWLLNIIFARRLQQMNMPIAPNETSKGMSSEIYHLTDKTTNEVKVTGWLRKNLLTGNLIYAGCYSHCNLPESNLNCVKVVFPLPNGSATVILKPLNCDNGALKIISSGAKIGSPGFYFIVYGKQNNARVKHVKNMKETLHVYKDSQGIMRTDHNFRLFGLEFLHLHYKITRKK